MDNFILYDEISKSPNVTIYKGRRKGSINFVSIHCIEKSMRPEITNLVRLTYEIAHKNIVRFYEWYETSNHLWLVVELCTGGTLDAILKQDICLPEISIKNFGADICEGLYYCHNTANIVFCDLHPRKIMVDGNGTLKLGDFGLSKIDGENLEEIFSETFSDQNLKSDSLSSMASNSGKKKKKLLGNMTYMAPEVLKGEENSKITDLWSFGCILYEMYTGHAPFTGDNFDQIYDRAVNKELPALKGNKMSTKASSEFVSLVKGLLEKDPSRRLTWKQLIRHPFWDARLIHLMPPTAKSMINTDASHLRISLERPKTAALDQKPEINVSFSMSSRLPASPQGTMHTRNAIDRIDSEEPSSASASQSKRVKIRNDGKNAMFFVDSELNTSQIIDNPKIQKPASLKFEPKTLPFTNTSLFKADTFLKMPKDEFFRQIELIKSHTNVPADKTAAAIKSKLHLMNYIGFICMESSEIANAFVDFELFKDLTAIIKSGHNLEMKMKAARILAILFSRATKVDSNKGLNEILQTITNIISSNRNDIKFKQALLLTLGEIFYAVSAQETFIGKSVDSWNVPPLAYSLLIRSVGEDLTTNHIVCKIIEKIASTSSCNVQKFISNQSEVVNSIWSCFIHSANNEALRVTALNALCLLTSHSISIFQLLIDKVGLDPCLDCLTSPNTRIQQSMLTMFAMYVEELNLKNIPEKKLISKIATIYDSTNVMCRAKAYLLTFVVLKQQSDLLIQFTNSKLVHSIERDYRKTFNNQEENDYIHKILNYLVSQFNTICVIILDDLVAALESVYGRKNPSTIQSKQLKKCIPNSIVLKIVVSSQTFRNRVLDETFLEKFGEVLRFSKPINTNELNVDTICGAGITSEYLNSLVCITESIVQFKETLQNYSKPLMQFIIPQLLSNIDAANTELSVQSLRILSEVCFITFNKQESPFSDDFKKTLKQIIENNLYELLEMLLNQPEPVPFFALTIVQSLLEFDSASLNLLKNRNICFNIIKLLNMNRFKIGNQFVLKLLNVAHLWSAATDPSELYENGIIDCLKVYFGEMSKVRKLDDQFLIETEIEMLKTLDNLLKYVSEFVKRALQAKKAAGSTDSLAQQAEKLLHVNKSLIGICTHLINMLLHDDNDISEYSCKNLWVIMQLFGGECKDLVNMENINIMKLALSNSNSKRQKTLLRIIKRIITADKNNLELFKNIGQEVIEVLKRLKSAASAEANVTLATMIDEIIKLVS